jgi:hypothetical protein
MMANSLSIVPDTEHRLKCTMVNAYVVDDESLRGAHVGEGVDAEQGLFGCGLEVDAELSFEERPSRRIRIPSRRVQEELDALKGNDRHKTKKNAAQASREKARRETKKAAAQKVRVRCADAEYTTTQREVKKARRADAEYSTTKREAKSHLRADAEYATTEREANALAKSHRRADAEYATTEREVNTLAKSHRRAEKKNEVFEKRGHRQG